MAELLYLNKVHMILTQGIFMHMALHLMMVFHFTCQETRALLFLGDIAVTSFWLYYKVIGGDGGEIIIIVIFALLLAKAYTAVIAHRWQKHRELKDRCKAICAQNPPRPIC